MLHHLQRHAVTCTQHFKTVAFGKKSWQKAEDSELRGNSFDMTFNYIEVIRTSIPLLLHGKSKLFDSPKKRYIFFNSVIWYPFSHWAIDINYSGIIPFICNHT